MMVMRVACIMVSSSSFWFTTEWCQSALGDDMEGVTNLGLCLLDSHGKQNGYFILVSALWQ